LQAVHHCSHSFAHYLHSRRIVFTHIYSPLFSHSAHYFSSHLARAHSPPILPAPNSPILVRFFTLDSHTVHSLEYHSQCSHVISIFTHYSQIVHNYSHFVRTLFAPYPHTIYSHTVRTVRTDSRDGCEPVRTHSHPFTPARICECAIDPGQGSPNNDMLIQRRGRGLAMVRRAPRWSTGSGTAPGALGAL
jgi:hypothetical protein